MTMNRSLIGYDNLLEQGTLTATNEDAGYPVVNIADWLLADAYKPAATGTHHVNLVLSVAKTANYFAFYGQTLYVTGGSIQLQYKDGGGVWRNASNAISPADNRPTLVSFAPVTATEWRVEIVTGGTIPAICVVSFGQALQPEHGVYLSYSEPLFARAPGRINSVSENGSFLGSTVYAKGSKTNLVLQYASDAWCRTYWSPFQKHMEAKPFFYCWDATHYPDECAFCWASGDVAPPSHTHYGFMGCTTPIQAQTE